MACLHKVVFARFSKQALYFEAMEQKIIIPEAKNRTTPKAR